jgi:hypothetical protein
MAQIKMAWLKMTARKHVHRVKAKSTIYKPNVLRSCVDVMLNVASSGES